VPILQSTPCGTAWKIIKKYRADSTPQQSDTIVQVLSCDNPLLPLALPKLLVKGSGSQSIKFYEEKVVFAYSLWYIAFFGLSIIGPSITGR
jgi:hypothetical protein